MEIRNKHILLVTGNSLTIIATIIINALAVILPINGKSTQELSDNIPNLFVPAGITFSIWSIIYIFLIIFIIYQILSLSKKQQYNTDYLEKIGGWFMLANLANIAWIFLWHYEFVTYSLLAMLVLFISLLIIYLKLDINLSTASLKEKIAVHTTISIYIGWITVATIANVTAVLVKLNVGELYLGQVTWTILVIAVATLISVLVNIQRKDIAYNLVIIWALLGIVIKRSDTDPIYGIQNNIAITATAAIIIIILVILVNFGLIFYKKKSKA
jgi:hypothetical protein